MRGSVDEAFSLSNRVAVVTGAASGLGREAALVFAEAGAHVVLGDVNERGLYEAKEAIGSAATVVPTDVSDRAAVERLATTAAELGRGIDVWANVAGTVRNCSILDATEADLDHMIAINLKGVYWGCAAASSVMKAQKRARSSTSRQAARTARRLACPSMP